LCKAECVAVHVRAAVAVTTTIAEHIPSAQRRYAARTIERIRADVAAIGPSIAVGVETEVARFRMFR
jgi:hypothetical protein